MIPVIVVHGGAGNVGDDRVASVQAGCAEAARAGLELLLAGAPALDAVQQAVRVLEDDPIFNAGVGSVLTRDGTCELDAALMEGATLRVGAIGAVENVRRPIELARLVLDDGEHVLLVGPAAWDFARERGVVPCPPEELITERMRERLQAWRSRHAPPETTAVGGGTVGACAIDAGGHVAAATSTGGMLGKRPGRVGDTPLPGAGTYADDRGGAASATGHGEAIVRVTLTRQLVDRLAAGAEAPLAAWAAVDDLGARVAGTGGVICVDRQGRIGLAHNTPRMSWAWATGQHPEPVAGVVVERGWRGPAVRG